MDDSILNTTKKVLGLGSDYTAFDDDVIMFVNSALSIVNQLGLGPLEGFSIQDDTALWEDIGLPGNQTNLLKTYVFLKVRVMFDPPATSFTLDAMQKQIEEYEWRLNSFVETSLS